MKVTHARRVTETPNNSQKEVDVLLSKPIVTRGNISVIDDFRRHWVFNGQIRDTDDEGSPVAHIDDMIGIPAKDLKSIMRHMSAIDYGDEVLHIVVNGTPDDRAFEYYTWSEVSFTIADEQLVMDLEVFGDQAPDDKENSTDLAGRIAPLLSRKKMWLVSVEEERNDEDAWWKVDLRIRFHMRGRTVNALIRDGLDIVALLRATAVKMARSEAIDLLRGGYANVLIGQPEGNWVEAKREHYDLKSAAGQIKLARAVSQFANSDAGGLVVIGLATKKQGGIDAIHAVTPMAHNPNIRRKYVQVLQNRIYPAPDNLLIEVITAVDGDLIIIDVPPQPEELKPFLVHGSIVDGRVNDTFISIVQRRDDEGIPASIASIHSTLAAGRALLRGGHLPRDAQPLTSPATSPSDANLTPPARLQ